MKTKVKLHDLTKVKSGYQLPPEVSFRKWLNIREFFEASLIRLREHVNVIQIW